jgi:hypothetical protein
MIEKQDAAKQRSEQSFEVRYSEKFLREKRRKDQRSMAFGALLMLPAAIILFKDSADAYRAHTWVNVAGRINQQVLVPPRSAACWGCCFSASACTSPGTICAAGSEPQPWVQASLRFAGIARGGHRNYARH